MPKTYSLNKFWHPAGDLLPRRAQTVVTLLILLFFLYKTGAIFKPFLFPDVNGYGYTEMLIDYGGGFVRRGMLGDLIHRLSAALGISPLHIIRPLCMAAFVAVAAFFSAVSAASGSTGGCSPRRCFSARSPRSSARISCSSPF